MRSMIVPHMQPSLHHIIPCLGIPLPDFDRSLADIKDVGRGYQPRRADQGIPKGEVMQPEKMAHCGDVD